MPHRYEGYVDIIPYADHWSDHVEDLFRLVNKSLAPAGMEAQFEAYVERSIAEEISRITAYYEDHGGGFWVVVSGERLLGMFGIEAAPDEDVPAMELRRMYVAPTARRMGLARKMLYRAMAEARASGATRMVLSTSHIQIAAIAFYKAAGFAVERVVEADAATTKSIGGIRRLYMARAL